LDDAHTVETLASGNLLARILLFLGLLALLVFGSHQSTPVGQQSAIDHDEIGALFLVEVLLVILARVRRTTSWTFRIRHLTRSLFNQPMPAEATDLRARAKRERP
jgi:hypothetical protein